jgi:diacylglycerol kinase (ATP)
VTLHAIVFNPASGGRPSEARARAVAGIFEADGHATRLLATRAPGHASELVETLLRERGSEPTDVVSLGGDGTLNEVLHGLFRASALVPGSHVRLLPLPGGTTNVVCRSLGLPPDALAAASAIHAGGERALDVGTCRIHAVKRPFLLACGAGFDAESLLRVGPLMKRLLGKAAYQLAAVLSTGERARGIVAELELPDGRRESVACASIICGASELYAGVLRISRTARPDDGLLEVAMLSSTRFVPLLRAAWAGGRTSLEDAPGVRVAKARSVRVSARAEVPVHVDAEGCGLLPAEIGIIPGALRMRVGGP